MIGGVARQPEAQGRLQTIFFLTVGLVEAAYFINLAFMALFVFVLVSSFAMSVALLAAAADKEPSNFLLPNATFLVELFAFFLVLYILWRYVVPPVSKAMTTRQETIRRQLDEGRESKERLEAAEAEFQRALLIKTRADTARIRDEATAEGRAIVEELRQRAQEEADRIAVREHARLEAERKQIVTQLRAEVGQSAVELAGKIVGESLDDEARQRRMVERFIAELESGEGGGRSSGTEPAVVS